MHDLCYVDTMLSRDDPKICVCRRPANETGHDSRDPGVKDAKWTMDHNTVRKSYPNFGLLRDGAHVYQDIKLAMLNTLIISFRFI